MVVEAVLRAVAALGGDEARTIAQTDGLAAYGHPHQASVFLGERVGPANGGHLQFVGSLRLRVLRAGSVADDDGIRLEIPRVYLLAMRVCSCHLQHVAVALGLVDSSTCKGCHAAGGERSLAERLDIGLAKGRHL